MTTATVATQSEQLDTQAGIDGCFVAAALWPARLAVGDPSTGRTLLMRRRLLETIAFGSARN